MEIKINLERRDKKALDCASRILFYELIEREKELNQIEDRLTEDDLKEESFDWVKSLKRDIAYIREAIEIIEEMIK